MPRVFIGMGSNEGDRLTCISRAVQALASRPGVRVIQLAPVLETDPVGGPPQGRYLNTVLEVETALEPRILLAILKEIERQLGRVPSAQRWAPRVIDLDLLLYDDLVLQAPDLCVPHPRLHERAFVLEPLAQLAPTILHPILRQSIAALRDQLGARPPVAPSVP